MEPGPPPLTAEALSSLPTDSDARAEEAGPGDLLFSDGPPGTRLPPGAVAENLREAGAGGNVPGIAGTEDDLMEDALGRVGDAESPLDSLGLDPGDESDPLGDVGGGLPGMSGDVSLIPESPGSADASDRSIPSLQDAVEEQEAPGGLEAGFRGADPRQASGEWTGRQEWTDNQSSDGSQTITGSESYEDDDHSMTIETRHEDGVTTQDVTMTDKKTGEVTSESSTDKPDEEPSEPKPEDDKPSEPKPDTEPPEPTPDDPTSPAPTDDGTDSTPVPDEVIGGGGPGHMEHATGMTGQPLPVDPGRDGSGTSSIGDPGEVKEGIAGFDFKDTQDPYSMPAEESVDMPGFEPDGVGVDRGLGGDTRDPFGDAPLDDPGEDLTGGEADL